MDSENIDKLNHLATKSNERLKELSSTFTHNHSKATTLISAIAIFLPLFLNLIKNASLIIMSFSTIPIVLMFISLYYILKVLIPTKIAYGCKTNKYDELIKKSLSENLLYEIGINNKAFDKNESIVSKQNKRLKRGIIFIAISLFLSLIMIIFNFYK